MDLDIDGIFGDSDFVTGPTLAPHVGLNESQLREWAVELDVPKAGNAYVWSRDNVERLLQELEPDDGEDEEEEDEDSEDEDIDDEDADLDDEDDEDADEEDDS